MDLYALQFNKEASALNAYRLFETTNLHTYLIRARVTAKYEDQPQFTRERKFIIKTSSSCYKITRTL